MSPERLLHHFDQITEAPDAVPRLRRFIVDLAILGKLGPNDSTDGLSVVLQSEIQVEKQKLLREGKIRGGKSLPPIKKEEIPVQHETTAVFVRLAEIAQIEKGAIGIQKAKPGEYPLIGLAEEWSTCDCYQFDAKAAIIPLISSTGHGHACIKRLHYQEGKFALSNILCAVIPYVPDIVSARFLYEYFCAYKEPLFVSKMIGTANVSLTIGKIGEVPVPIISPTAQNCVYELMTLCDELEVAQAKREKRRDRLVAATLHGLNNGDENGEPGILPTFKESARFYINHLPRLTTRLEHIRQLRQTILNLAVRGKLVPQDPNDEPVAALLQRIDKERAITAKVDRRADVELQELLAGELRWGVPPTWSWRGVADLVLFIDYRGKTPAKTDSGIRLITAKNVRRGFINLAPEEFVTETTYNGWMKRGFPREDDILFTTEAPMGNAAVVHLQEKFGLAQRVINFRPYGDIDSDFLVLQMLSEPFQSILDKSATGLTAKGIKATKLKRLPLAVPPLGEQRRIVAKVDELMTLCDELEAKLTSKAARRRQLLDDALYKALKVHYGIQ